MADYDLIQDVNYGPKPKDSKDSESAGADHTNVSRAIEHGRPDALGARGAMHLQRAAGNAAVGALVQRATDEESPVHKVVGGGGGSSLDDGVRTKMESSLGYDFSGVRVHTGSDAAAAAKSVQAQAFTVGNNVVFNEGKYNPGSPDGQRTIAHELTHVVQQSQGSVPGESIGGGIKLSDPGDWAEQQAENTADAVMAGDHAGHDHGSAGPSVQTLPLQRQDATDEDEMQQLPEVNAQRQDATDEDEMQQLPEVNAQRQDATDEDEMQQLPEVNAQRQDATDEDEMQQLPEVNAQRQESPEEEPEE